MKAARTLGPWVFNGYVIEAPQADAPPLHVATVPREDHGASMPMAESRANGRYIVQAVNSHDALVDALRFCLARLDMPNRGTTPLLGLPDTLRIARSALWLADMGDFATRNLCD